MRAKKHLGQHFLTSEGAIEAMVTASGAQKSDLIFEIGPGKGVLTSALLKTGATVIAIEKDRDLIPIIETTFAKEIQRGMFKIIQDDIIRTDLSKSLENTVYKVVANIPYYITGEIIRLFLEHKHQPLSLTLLVQKEVALRIVAKDKKESILSLSVKAFGTPLYITTVKRGSFFPIPSVDSAIIHIGDISHKKLGIVPSETFFTIIKAGFAHKRKKLISNLSTLYTKDTLIRVFTLLSIDLAVRGEDLNISQWIDLVHSLS